MQSNNKSNKWKIFGIIVGILCLICLVVASIGYLYFASQPPSTVLNNSGYYTRLTKVYYLGGFPSTAVELEGADVFTFEILNEEQTYARDKNQVYFYGNVIPDADPATFELLESYYTRDKNHVYISGTIFTDDPAHFEIISGYLMRDSQHIYWSENIISDDPSNLQIIENAGFYTYFRDSTTVYVNGGAIEGADVNTFEVISNAYSHDATQIFIGTDLIPADVSTFEVLEIPYSRDAESAFWKENIIPNADPQTFQVLNANFECSADATHAYYQDQLIQDFDPNTIPVEAQVIGCSTSEVFLNP